METWYINNKELFDLLHQGWCAAEKVMEHWYPTIIVEGFEEELPEGMGNDNHGTITLRKEHVVELLRSGKVYLETEHTEAMMEVVN